MEAWCLLGFPPNTIPLGSGEWAHTISLCGARCCCCCCWLSKKFGRWEADRLETTNGYQELIELLVTIQMGTLWAYPYLNFNLKRYYMHVLPLCSVPLGQSALLNELHRLGFIILCSKSCIPVGWPTIVLMGCSPPAPLWAPLDRPTGVSLRKKQTWFLFSINNNDLDSGSVDSVNTQHSLAIFALSLLPRSDHFLSDVIGWLTRLTHPFSYILSTFWELGTNLQRFQHTKHMKLIKYVML